MRAITIKSYMNKYLKLKESHFQISTYIFQKSVCTLFLTNESDMTTNVYKMIMIKSG